MIGIPSTENGIAIILNIPIPTTADKHRNNPSNLLENLLSKKSKSFDILHIYIYIYNITY